MTVQEFGQRGMKDATNVQVDTGVPPNWAEMNREERLAHIFKHEREDQFNRIKFEGYWIYPAIIALVACISIIKWFL